MRAHCRIALRQTSFVARHGLSGVGLCHRGGLRAVLSRRHRAMSRGIHRDSFDAANDARIPADAGHDTHDPAARKMGRVEMGIRLSGDRPGGRRVGDVRVAKLARSK